MAKTTIDSIQGVVTTAGSGVVIKTDVTFQDATLSGVQIASFGPSGSFSSSDTLLTSNSGLNILTGSSAITLTMPSPSDSAGTSWIFRKDGSSTQIISSSNDNAFTDGTTSGNSIQLAAANGSVVAFVSDGLHFLITAQSGSLTFA